MIAGDTSDHCMNSKGEFGRNSLISQTTSYGGEEWRTPPAPPLQAQQDSSPKRKRLRQEAGQEVEPPEALGPLDRQGEGITLGGGQISLTVPRRKRPEEVSSKGSAKAKKTGFEGAIWKYVTKRNGEDNGLGKAKLNPS